MNEGLSPLDLSLHIPIIVMREQDARRCDSRECKAKWQAAAACSPSFGTLCLVSLQAFGAYFKKAAPFFKMYSAYVSNYDRAMETLNTLCDVRHKNNRRNTIFRHNTDRPCG